MLQVNRTRMVSWDMNFKLHSFWLLQPVAMKLEPENSSFIVQVYIYFQRSMLGICSLLLYPVSLLMFCSNCISGHARGSWDLCLLRHIQEIPRNQTITILLIIILKRQHWFFLRLIKDYDYCVFLTKVDHICCHCF